MVLQEFLQIPCKLPEVISRMQNAAFSWMQRDGSLATPDLRSGDEVAYLSGEDRFGRLIEDARERFARTAAALNTKAFSSGAEGGGERRLAGAAQSHDQNFAHHPAFC
jgi:hypothetical protein